MLPSVTISCKYALIAISDAKKESCLPPAFLTKDISASLEFCHLYRGRQQYATPNLLLHSKRIPIAIQHLFPGTRLFLFNPDLLLTFTIQNIEEHVSDIYIYIFVIDRSLKFVCCDCWRWQRFKGQVNLFRSLLAAVHLLKVHSQDA